MTQVIEFNEQERRVNNLLSWYSFFMAFPAILIVQNISIYLFPFLFFGMYSLSGKFLTLRYGIQFIALLFGVGAILSVTNMPASMPANSLERAIEVLPNYLYWVILILFFTTHKEWIKLDAIYRGIFWGVLFSVLYFFVFQDFLTAIPVFKQLSQNTFAFLLICYAPMVVWYTWYKYGLWASLIALIILALAGFLSGSRSGSLLTLSGGGLTLLLNRKNTWTIYLLVAILYVAVISSINNRIVKNVVFSLNQRTYDLVYNRKKTLEEDRSYLVRLAQVEKSLLIFEKYPWTGIGLNNFTNYRVKLPGNFEGSEYVVNKKNIDKKSAHNSYFGFLAEGGLILFVPFAILLLYCMLWYVKSLRILRPEYGPIFIGILHMSIHLYFIYAILNVFAWFLIALGCWIVVKNKS